MRVLLFTIVVIFLHQVHFSGIRATILWDAKKGETKRDYRQLGIIGSEKGLRVNGKMKR